jgi:hypothetical protein
LRERECKTESINFPDNSPGQVGDNMWKLKPGQDRQALEREIELELQDLERNVAAAEAAEKLATLAADTARDALQNALRQAAAQGFALARFNYEVGLRNNRNRRPEETQQ